MNDVIRVHLNTGEISREPVSADCKWVAGRALTSRIVAEEVDPQCDVFGAGNKLVFATGLFAGTTVSCANRLSIGGKSPLTGGIKESNSGGNVAYRMARLGIRAIVFESVPSTDTLQILHVSKDSISLVSGEEYRGMKTYETAAKLRQQYGSQTAISLIGPTGERLSLASGIANTDNEGRPGRFAARGGLGALMGSKGIKAVVINDSGAQGPDIADMERFKALRSTIAKEIAGNETVANTYTKYGTAGMVNVTSALGALPTMNFSRGRFQHAEAINGDALYQRIVERGGDGDPSHSCMPGCVMRCSNVFADENGQEIVSPLEYETIGLVGSNCGIGDLDVIGKLNYRCNDLGLDTIDLGGAIGIAMETGLLPFGDGEGALKLLDEIEQDTWLGRILASGGQRTGDILGARRIPAVKKQIMAAYDPRAVKGLGVTYATSPMGADHTAGQTVREPVEHASADNQVETSRRAQITNTMHDSIGTCVFLSTGISKKFQLLADLTTAIHGKDCQLEDLHQIARETLLRERSFNRQAGLGEGSDRLPEFFYQEVNPDSGTVFDVPEEEMKKIYQFDGE